MAQPIWINVPNGFDMNLFVARMESTYQARGYMVNKSITGNIANLIISKDMDGTNKLLGMCESVMASCSVMDNRLTINFMDEEWTSKIIACGVGWFCCWIPLITGLVGVYRQVNLPKTIGIDATTLAPQCVVSDVPPVDGYNYKF